MISLLQETRPISRIHALCGGVTEQRLLPYDFEQFRQLDVTLIPLENEVVAYNLYNPWNVLNQLVVEKPLKIFREFDFSDLYQLVSDDPLHDMSDRAIVSDESVLPFGKYKNLDKTITDIMNKNPKYVAWCLKNYRWFAVSPTLIESWLQTDNTEI